MVSSSIMIVWQLFIGTKRHHPFDPDGWWHHCIEPSPQLRACLHVYILYCQCCFRNSLRPSRRPWAAATAKGLMFVALAAVLAQKMFLLHLYSVDNMSMEGQYHIIFQFVIFVSMVTTLMGVAMPKSFLVSFVRSSSVTFLGAWLVVLGFMLSHKVWSLEVVFSILKNITRWLVFYLRGST